mgnify:CR=1 FL=1
MNRLTRTKHPAVSAVVFIFFILFMLPFGMVILNSAKTSKEIINNAMGMPEHWGQLFKNITAIFTNESVNYVSAFFDSASITILSLAVIVVFSSMCAWVLVRNDGPTARLVFMLFVMVMVIPFQVLMYPMVRWLRIMGEFLHLPLLGTMKGIVFAYLGFGCPLSIFVFHGFIKNIPYELEEAATIEISLGETILFGVVAVVMVVLTIFGLLITPG